jgi:phosphatidate phosphatase APP1
VAARSTASGRTRSTTLSIVRASSHLAVDPGVASPGQAVSILGNGYSAGVTVNVSVAFSLYGGGNRTVTVAAQTNGSGQFSTHLAIPANAAAQQATVVAQGQSTRTTGVLSVRHINATIQTSSAYTSPGTTISVTGNGYLASDRIAVSAVVKLRDGSSKTLTASAVTDKNGRFTAQLQIPANGTAGTYSIVAKAP